MSSKHRRPLEKPQTIADARTCCICPNIAWYVTGEPSLKQPYRFYCALHRAEARARQRAIWSYEDAVREDDRIWVLTKSEKNDSLVVIPNNSIAQEEPESA